MITYAHEKSPISAGTILPIDLLIDKLPVSEYFKIDSLNGKLVTSQGGDSTDLEALKSYHDYFKIGRLDGTTQDLIEEKLIKPAKENLDSLIHDFTEKLHDADFLDGIYYCNQLREQFIYFLENIYDDHLTLINVKKITDSNRDLVEQSLDICSLATLLAIRSNIQPKQMDTICKGALLINIGRTQGQHNQSVDDVDQGSHYLQALGYSDTIVKIVKYKSSFEKNTPEPRLVIGIVKASFLYHRSLQQYSPSQLANAADDHSFIMKKFKKYVDLGYLNLKIYYLISRVFNESKSINGIKQSNL